MSNVNEQIQDDSNEFVWQDYSNLRFVLFMHGLSVLVGVLFGVGIIAPLFGDGWGFVLGIALSLLLFWLTEYRRSKALKNMDTDEDQD